MRGPKIENVQHQVFGDHESCGNLLANCSRSSNDIRQALLVEERRLEHQIRAALAEEAATQSARDPLRHAWPEHADGDATPSDASVAGGGGGGGGGEGECTASGSGGSGSGRQSDAGAPAAAAPTAPATAAAYDTRQDPSADQGGLVASPLSDYQARDREFERQESERRRR